MGGGVEIRVEDMTVQGLLSRLMDRMGNLSSVMDEIGSALLLRVQRTFEREEAPGGGPWAALSAATIRQRQRLGRWPGPILRREGNLYRSVNYQATSTSVSVSVGGPGVRYAAIHQFGGMAGRGRRVRIPARPVLFSADNTLPPAWLQAVSDILGDHLAAAA